MAKQIAPLWGNNTTDPFRLGPYEPIVAADWGGMQKRNHRTYAYEGQVCAQMFWPGTGFLLSASARPLINSRGAYNNEGGFTLAASLRPHQDIREFRVRVFGGAFAVNVSVFDMGGTSLSSINITRASTTPDWGEVVVTVPVDCHIRVLGSSFSTPGPTSTIYALSVAERVLEEPDL